MTLLAWIWEVDVNSMAAGNSTMSRLGRGALHAVVILLVVELVWHVLRSWIDRTLVEFQASEPAGSPEVMHRRARIRTLLPIARNVLLVVLAVMAVLMALSALGIAVGPLIAGAGVVSTSVAPCILAYATAPVSSACATPWPRYSAGTTKQMTDQTGWSSTAFMTGERLSLAYSSRGPMETQPTGTLPR